MPMNGTELSEKRVDRAFLLIDLQLWGCAVILLLIFLALCGAGVWLGYHVPPGGKGWL